MEHTDIITARGSSLWGGLPPLLDIAFLDPRAPHGRGAAQ
jgi:hypothetical protein